MWAAISFLRAYTFLSMKSSGWLMGSRLVKSEGSQSTMLGRLTLKVIVFPSFLDELGLLSEERNSLSSVFM